MLSSQLCYSFVVGFNVIPTKNRICEEVYHDVS